jgi:hypothetical protein
LPKALKEWPAFHALKKTIDDFNDICPLLELMSNKAMKYRHWQKIQQITGFTFDLERPGIYIYIWSLATRRGSGGRERERERKERKIGEKKGER